MVVWLVFGRAMMEVEDAGMVAAAIATTVSSGPGEEVVEDAILIVADCVDARMGFGVKLGWLDRRGIGSLAVTTSVQVHNKIYKVQTLLLVLRVHGNSQHDTGCLPDTLRQLVHCGGMF